MTRALVFFPHNLFPPRTGAHQRCLQIIQGLQTLGVETILASSTHTSDTSWDNVPETEWRRAGVTQLVIHRPSIWDARAIKYSAKFYAAIRRSPPLDSFNYAPPGLICWFGKLAADRKPDVIINNYAFWGRLVSPALHRNSITVMDTHDLVSLYRERFMLMERYLPAPPLSPAVVHPALVEQDFFEKHPFHVSVEEYRILDRYSYTLAITSIEAELIAQHTNHTRVLTLPMTQQVYAHENMYDGAALFTAGRNPFNAQGYLYFVARVLPLVLEQEPTFCLHITGTLCQDVLPTARVELRGFVQDLNNEYAHAPFLICPILGKTGQQVKIVEAMTHGVPAIATRVAAEGSPIRDGINGLIARDAAEFAAHTIRLWRDRETCRKLGAAARETIAKEFSQQRMLDNLSIILGRA
ncbi:MAG: glycosyltransferase [Anaerolineae bacterium]|nr:glycosyltransferase [Anaerolineae bacterium]